MSSAVSDMYRVGVDVGPWSSGVVLPEGGKHRLERVNCVSFSCEVPASVLNVGVVYNQTTSIVDKLLFKCSPFEGLAVTVRAVPDDGVDRYPASSFLEDYSVVDSPVEGFSEFSATDDGNDIRIVSYVAPAGYGWAVTVVGWNTQGSVSDEMRDDLYNVLFSSVVNRGDVLLPPGASLDLRIVSSPFVEDAFRVDVS